MPSKEFCRIEWGDTISDLAQRHGTTVENLCRINGIENPDQIGFGQIIALNARDVCKVKILLIDWDRNPIRNATVRLEYCGKLKVLRTGANGCLPEIITETPEDLIGISIMRPDRSWEKIAHVRSGWGNKLVTLRSPKLKLVSETRPHPKDASGKPIPDSPKGQISHNTPSVNPKSTIAEGKQQADYGGGKGPKTKEVTNKNGLPLIKVTNDQVELEFLKGYTGEPLEESDYVKAASELKCEVNVIKAIAKVESGGRSGFDKKGRPVILYERHIFSRHTGRRYDTSNPDVSSTRKYRTADESTKVTQKELEADYYVYSSEVNYQRLAKAYALDKSAAIMACSWGKFQILGENYKGCKYPTSDSFLADQVQSEKGQLQAFIRFVKMKCLEKALKEKNWAAIAIGYNGKYHDKYDKRIEAAYKLLTKKR